jgi:hypothetical protein
MSTMEFIRGWKFDTEQEALEARQMVDDYYEFPKPWDSITLHWTDYLYDGAIWYIIWDESVETVLGEPEEFEINID